MKSQKMSVAVAFFFLAVILGSAGGCASESTRKGASDSASYSDGVKDAGALDSARRDDSVKDAGLGDKGALPDSASGESADSSGATDAAPSVLGNGWDKASTQAFKTGDRIPMVVYALYLRGTHTMATYKKIVDQAAAHHFTHVSMVFWMTNLKCPSLVKGGFKFNKTALTIADVKTLADYIRSKGMEALPGMRLLTHQDDPWKNLSGGVGASFPFPSKYMLNKTTYDPNNKALMSMIYGCIDEMMPAFVVNGKPPVRFNIGHDEVVGLWPYDNENWLKCDTYSNYASCKPDQPGTNCDPVLSVDDYKNSILGLRKAITVKYGTRIAMYSDPLVQHEEVIPIEGKFNGHAGCVKGSANPFVQLRKSLPKDIIMLPWWYGFNAKYPGHFPEFRILQKEGFDVQPTVWPRPATEAANFAHVTQRIDEMLAIGHRHSGIVAAEFRAYEMVWNDVLQGIAKTGDYAYTTTKK